MKKPTKVAFTLEPRRKPKHGSGKRGELFLLSLVGALLATKLCKGTVDEQMAGDLIVMQAVTELPKGLRSRVNTATTKGKRAILREAQLRAQLVAGA